MRRLGCAALVGPLYAELMQLVLLLCSEPEALPFCALAYALIGIISTVLVALPPVARALLAITA